MEFTPPLKRRDFIKTGLLSFAGVMMLPSCLKDYSPFLFLTAEEASLLSAISDRIIPEDTNGPGATQAGVIYYIDKQLYEVFKDDQQTYRNGLKAIDSSCQQLHAAHFEDLDIDSRDLFLEKMEQNNLPGEYWKKNSASGFFSMIIKHSMQGFYGPPRHGGNKNYISYKIMDLDYPYVVGQNRYREKPIYED